MDKFYIIVIVVAVICLILCLVAVGLSLSSSADTPFPKLQTPCPDGWAIIDGSSCTVNSLNAGTLSNTSGVYSTTTSGGGVWSSTNKNWVLNTNATVCDKKKWAVANGVIWDGVSNYNQCK